MSTSAPALRVTVGSRGPWMVVEAAGELDYATCPELTDRLAAVIDGEQQPRVAVDVAGLEFCDSSGIRCLLVAGRRVRGRDGDLVVLRPPAWLRARIQGMGVAAMLPVADELPG